MKVHTATLAGGDNNQDRVFVTDNAVIVLDGASAFTPVDVDAGLYAETLGEVIAEQLSEYPGIAVAEAVATAITHAVQKLDLTTGRGPSSTVSVLRTRQHAVDLYALGDSPIHYGTDDTAEHVLADRGLTAVAPGERERYMSRLSAGHGYDAEHHARLVALQLAQRDARNRAGGYWIAEADPGAARHAIAQTLDSGALCWAVLATDGAADYIEHTHRGWRHIAQYDSRQLATLLDHIQHWESTEDPTGSKLPRAKRHDDKTIAAVDLFRTSGSSKIGSGS